MHYDLLISLDWLNGKTGLYACLALVVVDVDSFSMWVFMLFADYDETDVSSQLHSI